MTIIRKYLIVEGLFGTINSMITEEQKQKLLNISLISSFFLLHYVGQQTVINKSRKQKIEQKEHLRERNLFNSKNVLGEEQKAKIVKFYYVLSSFLVFA